MSEKKKTTKDVIKDVAVFKHQVESGEIRALAGRTDDLGRLMYDMYLMIDKDIKTLAEAEKIYKGMGAAGNYSWLLRCVTLWRLALKNLFRPTYATLDQYLTHLSDELKRDKKTLYLDIAIGESYMRFREELHHAGFSIEHDMSKLRIFNSLLAYMDGKELARLLPKMTYKQFSELRRPEELREGNDAADDRIEFSPARVVVDGKILLTKATIKSAIAKGYKLSLFKLMDDKEERATKEFIKRYRSGRFTGKLVGGAGEEPGDDEVIGGKENA